jgi:acyl carrier protein
MRQDVDGWPVVGLKVLTSTTDRTTVSDQDSINQIRQIIVEHARLPEGASELDPAADLYQAGMTSHASVNVMLALEDHFDVEFPDRMLKRSVFESIQAIAAALAELHSETVA